MPLKQLCTSIKKLLKSWNRGWKKKRDEKINIRRKMIGRKNNLLATIWSMFIIPQICMFIPQIHISNIVSPVSTNQPNVPSMIEFCTDKIWASKWWQLLRSAKIFPCNKINSQNLIVRNTSTGWGKSWDVKSSWWGHLGEKTQVR